MGKIALIIFAALAFASVGLVVMTVPRNRPDRSYVQGLFREFHPEYELLEVRRADGEVVEETFVLLYQRSPHEHPIEARWRFIYSDKQWFLHR